MPRKYLVWLEQNGTPRSSLCFFVLSFLRSGVKRRDGTGQGTGRLAEMLKVGVKCG